MTFILTQIAPYQGKVHDPDRKLELLSLGGGSGLRRRFRLVGQFDQMEFSGRTTGSSTPSEVQATAGIKHLINWELGATDRPFCIEVNPEEMVSVRSLIVEAMTQYGFAADTTAADLVSIQFLSPRGWVE